LYEKGYEREKIIKLFQVIDRMMTLPQELVQSFEERLNRYEEETRMPLLSNMELRGMERGLEQGLERGLEQGTRQTARDSVITVLRVRFGEVPTQLTDALNNIEDLPLLKQLLETAVNVNSMTEFQQFIVTE
jgi:flagellar biosynthesis/type III secretory pathway protein FliH